MASITPNERENEMLTLKIMWDEPRPGSHRMAAPPAEFVTHTLTELGVQSALATSNASYDAGREFVEGEAAYPDHFASRTRWVSDVTAVEVLDRGVYNSWRQVRQRHGRNVFGYTWLWDDDVEGREGARPVKGPFGGEPRDVGLTLILIAGRQWPDGEIILVEKAWLLGPDGQTIDRVAP